jgi:hypothetical protein
MKRYKNRPSGGHAKCKTKMKINPFEVGQNAFQSINLENTMLSPSNLDGLENDSRVANRLTLDSRPKSKSKNVKNGKNFGFNWV